MYVCMYVQYVCVGEFTVKTQGPDMMNEDQESEMHSIKEKFTEEHGLQFHQQKSVLSMEFVGRSAYNSKSPTIILLTEN